MEYLEVEEAIERPGLRLVLTAGVPGPWGESAKYILRVKNIPYAPVRQLGGLPNDALQRWTGMDNAPIAVYEDERPRAGWGRSCCWRSAWRRSRAWCPRTRASGRSCSA